VVQIESPKSVTRGLQRIGRAGHGVGEVSRGRLFPKFRADLLECAVVARRMREGLIETTVVPRNPLDVLAQQVVAMAAGAGEEGLEVGALHELVRRTWTFAELEIRQLENVLDMLDGRYPSREFAELRARIVWDREAGTIRARPGARALAVANAGTIPDRGLYSVNLPDGRRVGELDEEMVYEARTGQTFLLGASAWRIEEITRDRVVVTPAPGAPAAVPFWHGESVGRPRELGEAIGAFSRWAVDQDEATLEREYDLDERAARNLLAFLHEQQAATRVVPSDRTVVAERFRDEIGDWRLCLLTPFGGRVHAAWALALSARIRERLGVEPNAVWSDDGIIVHLPDADEPPDARLLLFEPQEVEDLVVSELPASALFGARFRENAARALLIPRAYPGRRTPLWQQRLKAQTLLEVARRYPQFPIVLETSRECLRDVLDVPGLIGILHGLQARELSFVEVETASASPFASSLLFDYVAAHMYEGDAPNAERRAMALALDRELLRELLGQEELRELIDPEALRQVEDELQLRAVHLRARDADGLHDVLRRLGDLSGDEVRERLREPDQAKAWLSLLQVKRRAAPADVNGEERWIATEDAALYRDALGVTPPPGLPDTLLAETPDALLTLVSRHARTHGPFLADELRLRYGVDVEPALTLLEQAGELVRGELRPLGTQREWCAPDVLRRVRRASLAVLRREIEPVGQEALAAFVPAWQEVGRRSGAGAGIDRLRDVLSPLQGLPLPPEVWERDVLPRRIGAYSPAWLDELCAGGEVVWAGTGSAGGQSGRVALYFREDAALLGRPVAKEAPQGDLHDYLRERLRGGACYFADLLVERLDVSHAALHEALWDLVWAGEVTNDVFAPLRSRASGAGGAPAATSRHAAAGRFRRRGRGAPPLQGRWSLTETVFGDGGDGDARRRAWAELLLERYGVVTRELARAESGSGGFAALYPALSALETLGVARRGYFVEGLGGAQFAMPAAVERLRAGQDRGAGVVVLAVADPAQLYGAGLRWPASGARTPARRPGAYVVLVAGLPALAVEPGGRTLHVLVHHPDEHLDTALTALVEAVRGGEVPRLALERIDGRAAADSPYRDKLLPLGFRPGLQRLTLARGS
jgi:ATP-dependent Lhr-like helicase